MKRYELIREQRERIKELLRPERVRKRGRPRKGDWNMLNGMLWIVRSGAQWRELPEAYGPLAVCVCPICQMTGRWYLGSHISRIVRRCGYGKPELGLYLHQGPRKCNRGGKRRIKQSDEPEAG